MQRCGRGTEDAGAERRDAGAGRWRACSSRGRPREEGSPDRGAARAKAQRPGREVHVSHLLRDAGVLGTEEPCDLVLEPEPSFPP